MPKILTAFIACLLLVPATALAAPDPAPKWPWTLQELDRVPSDPTLPRAHAVDVSGATAHDELPDLNAKPRIPDWLKLSKRGDLHAADHWGDIPVKEEQYQDEHGHVLTLATDNPGVDLAPFANLLASTYHYGEIEFVHAFVTDRASLERICGGDAAACYAADNPRSSPAGVMIVSYEDSDVVHGVIHEYGHHVDNQTYNLGGLSDCGIDGDGSRRWFFAREMQDRILDSLSCDPRPGWGQLLAEVFAEDYAQMVGIPPDEYHPAIVVGPPSERQKNALRTDLDRPFEPRRVRLSGRSGHRKSVSRRITVSPRTLPVFVAARNARGVRSVSVSGCSLPGFRDVVRGTCRLTVKTRRARQRFSFNLNIF